mgnify:CR=1 FL=1
MSLYPLVILTFFVETFWYWGFITFLYSSFWLYWCPGYTYLSGWVGKAQIYQKYVKFFMTFGICSLLIFGGSLTMTVLSGGVFRQITFKKKIKIEGTTKHCCKEKCSKDRHAFFWLWFERFMYWNYL